MGAEPGFRDSCDFYGTGVTSFYYRTIWAPRRHMPFIISSAYGLITTCRWSFHMFDGTFLHAHSYLFLSRHSHFDVGRYEKIPKVWNRNSRYEMDTQGMNKIHKVIKRVLRYEIEVFLKNSDFSFLYGSISYLFGYEKNRCFFLMLDRRAFSLW